MAGPKLFVITEFDYTLIVRYFSSVKKLYDFFFYMKNESEFFTGIQYFIERKLCFKGFDEHRMKKSLRQTFFCLSVFNPFFSWILTIPDEFLNSSVDVFSWYGKKGRKKVEK